MYNDRPVFNLEYYQRSADYIKKQIGDFKPKTGIILGTGLGGVADLIEAECIIPYEDIPNFLVSLNEHFHKVSLFHTPSFNFSTFCNLKLFAFTIFVYFALKETKIIVPIVNKITTEIKIIKPIFIWTPAKL